MNKEIKEKEIKEKIIQKGIMTKEDYENAPDWARNFALVLLNISEIDDFCSQDVTKFEKEKFLEELSHAQDLADISSCDRVSSNFEEKMKSIKFGVPNKIIPYLREFAIPEIVRNYEED